MRMGLGHPEIIERQDVFLRGMYHAVADIRDSLFPDCPALPRYAPLAMDFLSDALAASLAGSDSITF